MKHLLPLAVVVLVASVAAHAQDGDATAGESTGPSLAAKIGRASCRERV